MDKLKVLFHSDFPLVFTGFGKNIKNILSFLYKTGKYDLAIMCCGLRIGSLDSARTPWRSYGVIPANDQEIGMYINQFPPETREYKSRNVGYGEMVIDSIIEQERPDVYIGVQDFWGVDYAIDRYWFDKIHSVIWTTLDSLPLLPNAVSAAPKIKNFWVWSEFAEKEMHRLGHKHVKTIHGALDTSNFYRLPDTKRMELRKRFNIPADAFIIGDVFRNQLRKSVPNTLEGYKIWRSRQRAGINSFLLFHTSFSEGWNIHRLAAEYGINKQEILTTYICNQCKHYLVSAFVGQDQPCPYCGAKNSMSTSSVAMGTDEEQLNEVYNLMDMGVFARTSGGQEIPIQEAKLCELITAVTNYSCGVDNCVDGAGSLPMDWAEYREPGTEFKKASTYPESIAKQIDKVFNMDLASRRKMGIVARKWTIENFSIENVCKQIESFLDGLTPTKFDFDKSKVSGPNPNANMEDIITSTDDSLFVKSCYNRILNREPDPNGFQYWLNFLKQ